MIETSHAIFQLQRWKILWMDWRVNFKSDLKKMAIWQCMNKYGDLCYLYAENDKIIWQE